MFAYYPRTRFVNSRNRLIITLFVDTGFRVKQLRDIKKDDVWNLIKVTGKGNREWIVPILNKLKKEIVKDYRIREIYLSV